MNLSLSCRIAEGFLRKEDATMSLSELATLAKSAGYDAICMRASQVGIHSTAAEIQQAKDVLDGHDLPVTMVTGDFDIVYNNDNGPACLRNIDPYLNLAESLGTSLLRVCIRSEDDLAVTRLACDKAADRGMTLLHQCHAESEFETVDQIVQSCESIDHPAFGIVFEAANLEECRNNYGVDSIRRLAPWIRNVYLQNQRVTENGSVTLNTWSHGPISFDIIQIPESGGIDFKTVFTGLHDIGYDGIVTVHQAGPDEQGVDATTAAKETASFIRELWEATLQTA